MSKKKFLQALESARRDDMAAAIETLRALDRGFVRKRIEHYKTQIDKREAAYRLDEAFDQIFPPCFYTTLQIRVEGCWYHGVNKVNIQFSTCEGECLW